MTMLERGLEKLLVMKRQGLRYVLARAWYDYRCPSKTLEKRLSAVMLEAPKLCWEASGKKQPLEIRPALRQAVIARAEALLGEPLPDWHPGSYAASAAQHFAQVRLDRIIGDDAVSGFIPARFHWAVELALAAAAAEEKDAKRYLACLQTRTAHWLQHNGYHRGMHWVESHEVSVRGWHLMVASQLLVDHAGCAPTAELIALMTQSFRRVQIAQGHRRWCRHPNARSEQLFLLYAATWLANYAAPVLSTKAQQKLAVHVRESIRESIRADGSCESHVSNDSRAFADILVMAKYLDSPLGVGFFVQADLQHKMEKLAAFLEALIEPISGAMPLFGQHDGALHAVQYHAHFAQAEPTLLALCAAFDIPAPARLKRAEGKAWLYGFTPRYAAETASPREQHFAEFGLVIHHADAYRAYVKYPRAHTEPTETDFLHLDLWIGGKPLLCDGGTYRLNPAHPAREGGLREAQAHSVPLRLYHPFLERDAQGHYRYWPETRVRHTSHGAWNFSVMNSDGTVLRRRMMFEPKRIVLRDRISDAQPWGIAMHGDLHEARGNMAAQLADRCRVTFLNAQSLSISDTVRADAYGQLHPCYRLLVEPMVTGQPITTMMEMH